MKNLLVSVPIVASQFWCLTVSVLRVGKLFNKHKNQDRASNIFEAFMKLRTILFVVFISLLLAACNMTLAQDVTPPPGYVPPTPVPTHGPLFPAKAPDLQNGAAIYAEKCTACHGTGGLGDGPQGQQLPVSVPPLGVSEVAWKAAPADWFLIVTLGNMDNFMPPFASLNDQERWDVVAYAQSLSSTPELVGQGENLFSENCADCSTDFFTSRENMAVLSMDDLVRFLEEGGEGIPALGESLSEDELKSIAVYLRTLTFPASVAASEPAPVIESPEPAPTEAPSVDGMPTEAEQTASSPQGEATPEAPAEMAGFGSVSGRLVNGSGGDVPSGQTVTLIGFDHAMEAGGTPVEVVNETVESDGTGKYVFENVELFENRIFLVETTYQGISFQSELAFSEPGMTELNLADLTLYDSTTESGGLVIEQLHVSFDMANEGSVQISELFTISNLSDKAYTFTTDGTSLPFLPLPEGAANVGLELSQDSAPLMLTDEGFAILPSGDFYSIVAFFSMPYDKKLVLNQPFALPVSSALVIVPEGIKIKTDQLTDEGIQQTQQGFNVQIYSGGGLNAGTPLEMTLSGKAKIATAGEIPDNRQMLLIGAGAFGVVLILAGVWMFMRDRGNLAEDDFEDYKDDETNFETAEEVMDAIIALDDLHRAKKIADEAYQTRRAELKELLKGLV